MEQFIYDEKSEDSQKQALDKAKKRARGLKAETGLKHIPQSMLVMGEGFEMKSAYVVVPVLPLKVKQSTGVMTKDGSRPYAAGTLHYMTPAGMMCFVDYTMHNLAMIMAMMSNGQAVGFKLIDEQNRQVEINIKAK